MSPEGAAVAPGLIRLPSATFQSPSPGSTDRMTRAREVARQWWGAGVAPATVHDQWLTEALAEFSSLWDAQVAARDNKHYFDRLEEMRRTVVGGPRVSTGTRPRPPSSATRSPRRAPGCSTCSATSCWISIR